MISKVESPSARSEQWEIRDTIRAATLGFMGYIFEYAILLIIFLGFLSMGPKILPSTKLLLAIVLFNVLGAVAFWSIWMRNANRVRWLFARYMSRSLAADSADIKDFPAIHSRYVPEITLIISVQAAAALYLLFLPWVFFT